METEKESKILFTFKKNRPKSFNILYISVVFNLIFP